MKAALIRALAHLVNAIPEGLMRLTHYAINNRHAHWADTVLHADEWAEVRRSAAERRAREVACPTCGEMVDPEDIATTAVSVGLPGGASSTHRYDAATGRVERIA